MYRQQRITYTQRRQLHVLTDQDFNGTVNVNFVISDTAGANVSTSASFILNAVNDAPEQTGQTTVFAPGAEDLPYTITSNQLLAGFTDSGIT